MCFNVQPSLLKLKFMLPFYEIINEFHVKNSFLGHHADRMVKRRVIIFDKKKHAKNVKKP